MSDYLEPFETELVAGEEVLDGRSVPDETAMRIYRLTQFHLEQISVTDGGWSVLFRDPDDGRLWEHTYPQGELHGGGPAVLHVLDEEEVRRRYGPSVLGKPNG